LVAYRSLRHASARSLAPDPGGEGRADPDAVGPHCGAGDKAWRAATAAFTEPGSPLCWGLFVYTRKKGLACSLPQCQNGLPNIRRDTFTLLLSCPVLPWRGFFCARSPARIRRAALTVGFKYLSSVNIFTNSKITMVNSARQNPPLYDIFVYVPVGCESVGDWHTKVVDYSLAVDQAIAAIVVPHQIEQQLPHSGNVPCGSDRLHA